MIVTSAVFKQEEEIVDEFISLATQQLGIGAGESRSATAGILQIIKEKLGDSAFAGLLAKLPGAEALLGEADSGSGDGGGLMGSLTSMAGGLLGGRALPTLRKPSAMRESAPIRFPDFGPLW